MKRMCVALQREYLLYTAIRRWHNFDPMLLLLLYYESVRNIPNFDQVRRALA